MRRLKCLSLVLLSGVLSLLLPCILLVSNTNALTISSLRRSYVRYINFTTTNPSATFTDQSIASNVFSPIYNVSVSPNTVFRFNSLTLRLADTLRYEDGDKWDITLYYYLLGDSFRGLDGETLIPTVLCPRGTDSNDSFLDECEVKYFDMFNSPIDLTPLSTSTPTPDLPAGVQSKVHGYYSLTLKGHFINSGSGNALPLTGYNFAVYNPATLSLDLDYMLSFSVFRIYKEVPDEDKAAEELDEMNQKDDQDRSDIESQSSNIDSSGESSQQSAENTGTTLLAAFSSFVTAITSASPSNCNIDMDLGNLDLGIVNFCTLSPPPEFQVLGSIFLILFCVPLSIATARKVISLFRSFQG